MNKKYIEISVSEYAKKRGISRQAVLSAIKNKWAMYGCVSHRKIGKQRVIKVNSDFLKK